MRKQPKMNTALSLVVALGAYCPTVKLSASPEVLAREQMANKRRKRPLIGRGNYGANLMHHFDQKRKEAKASKLAAA